MKWISAGGNYFDHQMTRKLPESLGRFFASFHLTTDKPNGYYQVIASSRVNGCGFAEETGETRLEAAKVAALTQAKAHLLAAIEDIDKELGGSIDESK